MERVRSPDFNLPALDTPGTAANPNISYPLGRETEQPLQHARILVSPEPIAAIVI